MNERTSHRARYLQAHRERRALRKQDREFRRQLEDLLLTSPAAANEFHAMWRASQP